MKTISPIFAVLSLVVATVALAADSSAAPANEASAVAVVSADARQGVLPSGKNGKPLNLDFEDGTLRDWTATGEAFNGQPVKGPIDQNRKLGSGKVANHQGNFWIGGYEKLEDKPRGTLTSVSFKVTHPWAAFRLGAANLAGTRVELVRADTNAIVFTTRGRSSETMQLISVDLQAVKDQEIFIRLIDDESGGWGHINFDAFCFYAQKPSAAGAVEAKPAESNAAPRDAIKFAGLSPEEAAKAMTLPPGFKATLFAGEPDVKQPVAFAIDDRGRLWVAEAYSYPIRQPEGQGKDRIVVFEDKDGDGTFDRRTVFMEGLNLVSGMELGFGGLWVGAAPYLYFIPIADGDEPKPAGAPKILLDGWGYGDTHETLNTFAWGPDGWLYGCHGVFTHSAVGKPGTADEQRTKINAGIWRYHPTQHRFEVFAEGTSNPWGLDFNDYGHAIIEACVIPHLWHVIQGAHYHRQAGQHFNPHLYDDIKTIADHFHYAGKTPHGGNNRSDSAGGGHAHAGLMVYLGGSWPEKYRGQAFMNNIHGARINVDALEPKGSGYVGKHAPDFLLFNDAWSQIVNLQYDQDGSVYLIDWYDKQQCHTRNVGDHDRSNGRVFKVVYGDTKVTPVDLQQLSDDDLVMSLLRKNEWYVRHARRILQERAAAHKLDARATQMLRNLLGIGDEVVKMNLPSDHHRLSSREAQLRVLWALHVIGGLGEADVIKLASHSDVMVRAWSIQLALQDGKVSDRVAQAFTELARTDASPVVRLYLASAAQRLAPHQVWDMVGALHTHGEDAGDHNLPLMAWYALEPLVAVDFSRALALALESKLPRTLEFTSRRVASLGTSEAMTALTAALADVEDEPRQVAILSGVAAALKGQRTAPLPVGWERVEERLISSASPDLRGRVQALSLTFGSPRALAAARQTVQNVQSSPDARQRALDALLDVKDAALPPVLLKLLAEPGLRASALRGLAAYADPQTPAAILAIYATLPPEEKRDALLTLAARPAFARSLLAAVADDRIPARDLSADIARQVRGLNQPELTAQLEKVWGVARETAVDKKAAMAKYKALIENPKLAKPNPSHGRVLYTQTCAACHTLFGEGGKIGPDITGSNRADIDYLLHNIVDPNAEIPNAYRTAMVELKDGRVLAGVANQQDLKVVTVTTPNETLTLPRSEIKALTMAETSMMPEGLLAPWSDAEVRDLIAYLRSPAQVPLPDRKP
jgi:putative membrane-bound dehydrogenase-like protein